MGFTGVLNEQNLYSSRESSRLMHLREFCTQLANIRTGVNTMLTRFG